jgi:hypothetical protein
VTAETLEQFGSLVSEVQSKALDAYAVSAGLSKAQLSAIRSGQDLKPNESWRYDGIRREIDSINEANYSIKYDDGSSLDSSQLSEIERSLKSRSSRAIRFSANAGKYGNFKLDLTIREYLFSSAEWSLSGERADVRDVDEALRHLLENCEPEFAFLHNRWQWFYTYFGGIALTVFLYLLFVAYLPLGPAARASAISFFPIAIFLCPIFALFWSRSIEKTFPLVEFAYGRSAQRQNSSRKLIQQILAVILIPAAMAAAPALWANEQPVKQPPARQ